MKLKPLPTKVQALLNKLQAPPRLVAHLTLVHDVAYTLINGIDQAWPNLDYDRTAVTFGAATHDIGKAVHREELIGHGKQHEEVGVTILKEAGFPEDYARFAWTHGGAERESEPTVEDLLVRLADTIWKGVRKEALEKELCDRLATRCREKPWDTYIKLDDLICSITESADERLAWQAMHPA